MYNNHTWYKIFILSSGDTHVLETAPATPPATKFLIWLMVSLSLSVFEGVSP